MLPITLRNYGELTLREAARTYVEEAGRTQGVAIALVTREGTEFAFAGSTGRRESQSVTRETLFEIGSITKVFTGLLLADSVERGVVSLETTVGELLPGNPTLDPEVANMTLRELTTHTSGLPRLPHSGRQFWRQLWNPTNPYAGSTAEEIFDPLAFPTLILLWAALRL